MASDDQQAALGGASGSVGNQPTLVGIGAAFGFETPQASTARIQEAVQGLEQFGVPVQQFTHDAILDRGLTPNQFVKLIRTFTGHPDPKVRASLIQAGIKQDFFTHPQYMTVRGFIDLCRFVKGKQGQEILSGVQRKLKLEKKAGASGRVDIAALREALNVQIAEMASKVRATRKAYDARMAHHRKQIRKLEKERDVMMADIRDRYKLVADPVGH